MLEPPQTLQASKNLQPAREFRSLVLIELICNQIELTLKNASCR